MRIGIIGKVLRHTWAIDERYALASGNIIAGLFAGNEIDVSDKAIENENAKPYAISIDALSGNKRRVSVYDEAAPGSVAVIPVRGPLMKDDEDNCGEMNAGMATLASRVKEADNHPNISSTILYIDSPGGTVDGTQAFADAIKATVKPVVAFVDGLMASAAMWIGSAADHIIAENTTTEIGSIGVMVSFIDMRPMWEKEGVKFHSILSDLSADKNKEFYDALQGNYDRIKEDSLNPLAQIFIDTIKENRAGKATDEDVFTGKVYFAPDALKKGLIDEIGSFDTAVERSFELYEKKRIEKSGTSASVETDTIVQLSKPNNEMKNLAVLCALLGVASFEATSDGVFLSVEQAEAIEDRLAEMAALEQSNTESEKQVQTSASDLSAANERISELETELVEARKLPGADSAKAISETDPGKTESTGEKPVVQEGDDIMTAIDKVSKAYLGQ